MFPIKNIAILGVDGTGKSSVLSQLKKELGEQCVLQYMGYRSFEDDKLKKLVKKTDKTIGERIYLIKGIYDDLKNRVRKNRNFPGIVIFDRYVHEIYLNASGASRLLYRFLYKTCFPKPDAIVYLYCDAETSLKRKDDIPDKKQFCDMKERFDNAFLDNPSVLSLSSDLFSSEELAQKILKYYKLM